MLYKMYKLFYILDKGRRA